MRLAPTRGLIPRSKAEGSLSLHIDRFHVSHASGQVGFPAISTPPRPEKSVSPFPPSPKAALNWRPSRGEDRPAIKPRPGTGRVEERAGLRHLGTRSPVGGEVELRR